MTWPSASLRITKARGGEDTGTPVIHEYDAKMPFKFTGTLEKVQIKLGPNELAPQQRGELEQLKRDFDLAQQRSQLPE